jgi:hypothetical protein
VPRRPAVVDFLRRRFGSLSDWLRSREHVAGAFSVADILVVAPARRRRRRRQARAKLGKTPARRRPRPPARATRAEARRTDPQDARPAARAGRRHRRTLLAMGRARPQRRPHDRAHRQAPRALRRRSAYPSVAAVLARGLHDPGALALRCEEARRAAAKPVPVVLALGPHVPDCEVTPHDLSQYAHLRCHLAI